jgi:hypothetical protein
MGLDQVALAIESSTQMLLAWLDEVRTASVLLKQVSEPRN